MKKLYLLSKIVLVFTLVSCTKDILFQKKSIDGLTDQTELSDHANQYFAEDFSMLF